MKYIILVSVLMLAPLAYALNVVVFDRVLEFEGECQLIASDKDYNLKTLLRCENEDVNIEIYIDNNCNSEYFISAVDEDGEKLVLDYEIDDIRHLSFQLHDKNKGGTVYTNIMKGENHCLIGMSHSKENLAEALKQVWREKNASHK